MGKLVHDDVLDAALDVIATATKLNVCTASADTFAKATSSNQLLSITVNSGNYTGPADNASGGGRKLTCAVSDTSDLAGVSVAVAGTAAEVALTLAAGSKLFYVTTLAATKALTTSDTVNVGSFEVAIKDPT